MTRILLVVTIVSLLLGTAAGGHSLDCIPAPPDPQASPLEINSDPWLDNDRESARREYDQAE